MAGHALLQQRGRDLARAPMDPMDRVREAVCKRAKMAPSALMPRHAKADPHAHGCCAKGKSEPRAGGGGGEGGGGSDVRGFQLRRQLAWQNVNELGPMTYETDFDRAATREAVPDRPAAPFAR